MRAIIQRVLNAAVSVDGKVVSSINKGICVLVGISKHDGPKDAEFIARKIVNARLWPDDKGRAWAQSVKSGNHDILLVSQFTLYSTFKGNKPDYRVAMKSEQSRPFYEQFVESVRTQYIPEKVKDGVFGAMMQVSITNDGPTTIILDTEDRFRPKTNALNSVEQKDASKPQRVQQAKPQQPVAPVPAAVTTGGSISNPAATLGADAVAASAPKTSQDAPAKTG